MWSEDQIAEELRDAGFKKEKPLAGLLFQAKKFLILEKRGALTQREYALAFPKVVGKELLKLLAEMENVPGN